MTPIKYDLKCLSCGAKVHLHSQNMDDNSKGYKYDSAYHFLVKTLQDLNIARSDTNIQLRDKVRAALIFLGEAPY